jgi:2-polyprenyl-6-methoxyphenol hydroxylase-like FAD-dependent oxidoreductase
MLAREETDVVIIGAGPVGLALAIEFGRLGICCVVIEQNDRVGYSPRAKTTNVRTREHLRRWGIADNLRKASKLPANYPSNVVFATRMDGPQLTKIENALSCSPEKNDLYSESAQWVPQYVLEEVMRAHAVTFPSVEIRFNSSFIRAEQGREEVVTTIEATDTKEQYSIRSRYLVGADGHGVQCAPQSMQ